MAQGRPVFRSGIAGWGARFLGLVSHYNTGGEVKVIHVGWGHNGQGYLQYTKGKWVCMRVHQ